MNQIRRVAVIGLDCAEPSLVFDKWAADLPNLTRLRDGGLWGTLESCMPPITVPAWTCMATGRDPGTLGIYGFRNRRDWSYENLDIATNLDVREPRIWDYLSAHRRPTITVGIPQTFPITRPPLGAQITCFLTPGVDSPYTHPPELKQSIAEWVGEYLLDVKDFRTADKERILRQIYTMTQRRFEVCRRLVQSEPWELFWMVEMGTDRIHHGFWQYMDPKHHRFEADNPMQDSIRAYYREVDAQIGRLLEALPLQETVVWVVSDHGAKRMDGGVCFNDWLIREGFLVMKLEQAGKRKFEFSDVDWSRTTAWGEGGYYGRLFLNVDGREPQGKIPKHDYEAVRDELIRRIEAMKGPDGNPLGNKVYKPNEIYRQVNGVPPDLVVIFGDLHWRSVGMIGNEDIFTYENDTGPDDANHAQLGMHILSHPSLPKGRRDASIYDVFPTLTQLLRVQHGLTELRGKSLV